MEIENENVLKHAVRHAINLFLGAGFSVLARDSEGRELPTGGALAKELCDAFELPSATNLQLPQICTIIEHSRKAELRQYLKQRFTVVTYDDAYNHLDRVHVAAIFTTNIDDLVYKIYDGSSQYYINDIDKVGPAHHDRSAIDVVTLHGSVLDDMRPLRFGSAELAGAFASDPDRWHFLTQRLQNTPTLFWGYSVADAGALQALNPETVRERQHKDKWIVLRPTSADEATRSFFRALGFQLVLADTHEMLQWIEQHGVVSASVDARQASTKEIFPAETIPDVGTVPVRPLLEFFSGSPPQWSDIFSGRLYQTSQFNKVRDSVYSGKNTLVLGVPACGKTTLIMRLAAEAQLAGHKLMCDALTLEKAEWIGTRLAGAPAFIFLDNFADSIDAVAHLTRSKNVQLVGADRDYNFTRASHRIDTNQFNIIDVTDLTAADIQGCLETIPKDIVASKAFSPRTDMGRPQSLFEVIESHVKGPTLRQRFTSVLHELRRANPALHDLLLMLSYVHMCRTPVSMDMIIAFLRDVTSDFREVTDMCKRLGEMVSEYRGELADTEQDHFVPRSTVVAEAALSAATNEAIRSLMLRFLKNVSPYRICRYDVFKRSAYDADLAVRAFPKWEDGMQFYNDLYVRDSSAYALQQGAVYLSRKHRHTEAFEMIDQAVIKSGGRVWSIRNSHAIILFKANIQHANDPMALRTLQQSMEILTECYRWDKRKPFHALAYADQALELWNVLGDDAAIGYLETARKWLLDEAKRSAWNRGVKRLLPIIMKRLEGKVGSGGVSPAS